MQPSPGPGEIHCLGNFFEVNLKDKAQCCIFLSYQTVQAADFSATISKYVCLSSCRQQESLVVVRLVVQREETDTTFQHSYCKEKHSTDLTWAIQAFSSLLWPIRNVPTLHCTNMSVCL